MDEFSYPSFTCKHKKAMPNDFGSHFSLDSEELHSNQAQLNYAVSAVSSGFSYFTPSVENSSDTTMDAFITPATYQISSSKADKETCFGQPFQSDSLRGDSRKRPIEQTVNARALKVPSSRRSQKLSDKISSLQKVVSPYGKTDTASVLQETCMFIKIAHQEIRRLTISYFRARPLQPQHEIKQFMNGITEYWNPDLRSRGLCLAPSSMTSQLSDENVAESSTSCQGVTTTMNSWRF